MAKKSAIEKNKNRQKLVKKYKDQDVVLIGIHDARRGWDKIDQVVKQYKINYPLARDDGSTTQRWKVSFWPTYAVVDREGIVRAIGLDPSAIERVVKRLLDEGGAKTDETSTDTPEGQAGTSVSTGTTRSFQPPASRR